MENQVVLKDSFDQAEVISVLDCGPISELRLEADAARQMATVFKALSHPVRLQILDILSRHSGQVCVCEIERHFSLTQPTISHHLKILRDAKLITSEQRGLWVYHRIEPAVIDDLAPFLDQLK
jgi:ArsR family transcriptional regulator